jgi:S1-C subfamily serine protease
MSALFWGARQWIRHMSQVDVLPGFHGAGRKCAASKRQILHTRVPFTSSIVRSTSGDVCLSTRTRTCQPKCVLTLCVLSWFVSSPAMSYANMADQIAELKQSILFITAVTVSGAGETTEETGTGFIVTSSGFAFTANHVVAAPNAKIEVSVGSRFGPRIPAVLIPTGPNYADAALLQLPASLGPYHPVHFGNWSRLTPGGALLTVGFPLQSDISPAAGILAVTGGPGGLWQVSVPLNYGNSGGPVADDAGRIVGMVRGGVADAQQINYIIPLNLLAPLVVTAGLRWPPFDTDDGAAPVPKPVLTTSVPVPLPRSGQPGQSMSATPNTIPPNCTEVTDVAAGVPPIYTKRLECR